MYVEKKLGWLQYSSEIVHFSTMFLFSVAISPLQLYSAIL